MADCLSVDSVAVCGGDVRCCLDAAAVRERLLASYASGLSVTSAQSFFAAVASCMIALTGIVFSVGLVMVQFSAMAYSPRLVLIFARDPMLFHSLGMFIAACPYSLGALAWVDREGSGIVPLFSGLAAVSLLSLSMLLFPDAIDQEAARHEDRQGLGLLRRNAS